MKLEKNLDNLKQIAPLVQYAFGKNNDLLHDDNFMSRYDHSDGYGFFNDKKLISKLMLAPFAEKTFPLKLL